MALNHKRQKFVEEYLKCWNAKEAAESAGYKFPRRQGSRLLTDVDIRNLITERLDELHMSADEVLERLARIARADPRAHFVNASDVIKALGLLGKHRSLFKERLEISTPESIQIEVRYAEADGYTYETPPDAAPGYIRKSEVQRPELREEMGEDETGA